MTLDLHPDILLTAAYLADEVYRTGTEVDDLCYLASVQGGIAYLALRGTHNAVNVIRDLRVFPPAITPSGCLGHRGVISGYRKLVKGGILNDIPKGPPLVLSGHSLGGGEVLPFAELLGCPVVTFGAMAVYLRGMSPKIPHYRIVNDDDPVQFLPGIFHTHDCKPYITFRDHDREWLNVEDHDMALYINRLDKWAIKRGGTVK